MCCLEKERGGEPGVKQMGGSKEIGIPTLARRNLPRKRTRQVGTTKSKWVRENAPKNTAK